MSQSSSVKTSICCKTLEVKLKQLGRWKVLSEHPLLCGYRKREIQEYSLHTPCVLLSRQTTPGTVQIISCLIWPRLKLVYNSLKLLQYNHRCCSRQLPKISQLFIFIPTSELCLMDLTLCLTVPYTCYWASHEESLQLWNLLLNSLLLHHQHLNETQLPCQ